MEATLLPVKIMMNVMMRVVLCHGEVSKKRDANRTKSWRLVANQSKLAFYAICEHMFFIRFVAACVQHWQ